MDVSELPPKYIKACAFSGAKEGSPSSVSSISSSMPAYTDDSLEEDEEGIDAMAHESLGVNDITLEEWQAWGSSSQIPAMVRKTIDNLKLLEHELEIKMNFCGPRGKLQGKIRIEEDKKHRATYKGLSDSEQKLQFFTARQVACRLLGSRGYLCQNCWLPLRDCMCSKLVEHSLWQGIHFWLYMHPKDFLRKNNTGKLLWQVYGKEAAQLCIYGIQEHEETMWNAFRMAGRDKVWCLYPEGNYDVSCVHDLRIPKGLARSKDQDLMMDKQQSMNFILIDGTWNNSRAMLSRLKRDARAMLLGNALEGPSSVSNMAQEWVWLRYNLSMEGICLGHISTVLESDTAVGRFLVDHARAMWGEESLPCVALSHTNVSVMHRLRPQPSLDRTCTAAASIQLLSELNLIQELALHRLDQSAEALENSLGLLLDALSGRRQRMGRSIIRPQRWKGSK